MPPACPIDYVCISTQGALLASSGLGQKALIKYCTGRLSAFLLGTTATAFRIMSPLLLFTPSTRYVTQLSDQWAEARSFTGSFWFCNLGSLNTSFGCVALGFLRHYPFTGVTLALLPSFRTSLRAFPTLAPLLRCSRRVNYQAFAE
ncbi:hypothetical protein F4802DRAFT_28150 [Xylaria palmicola]|nr:hypothetical protein F4802DRAFT_28150 [Xylaria palmicola]